MLPRRPLHNTVARPGLSPGALAGQPGDIYHDGVGDGRGTIQPPAVHQPGGHAAPRRHRGRNRVLWTLLVLGLVVGAVLVVVRPFGGGDQPPRSTPPTSSPSTSHNAPLDARGRPYRPFRDRSWWNTPVPANAPSDPQAAQILNYLSTAPESGQGCLRLAGAQHNKWGQPAYWSQPGDPEYAVQGLPAGAPHELKHLRIPEGARGADNSDGTMSVYDMARGYVVL